MTRDDRTALPLPWAFVGSLLLHVGLIAPVGLAIMHSDAGGIAPSLRGTVDLSIVEPPPPPEHEEQELELGIENGAPSSLNWIGFEEYEKHLAMLSETEQPALGTTVQGPELVEGAPVPIAAGGAGVSTPTVAAAATNPPSAPPPPAEPTPQAVASTNDPLMPKADAGGTLVTTPPPPPQPSPPPPPPPPPGVAALQPDAPPTPQPGAETPSNPAQPSPPPSGDVQIPDAVREPGLLGHGSQDHSVTIAPPDPPPTPPTAPAADAPSSVSSDVTTEAPPAQSDPPQPSSERPDAPAPVTPLLPPGPQDPAQPVEPTSPLHPADAPLRAGSIKDDSSTSAPPLPSEAAQQPTAPPPSPESAPASPSAAPPSSSAPPSQPAAPAQSPATGTGMPSDKESDATSIVEVPRANWRNGKPLAARGLELTPRRPQFTTLMRVTSAPGNPICLIQFGREGKPVSARLLRSTGDSQVDEVIFNSLYGWRASGQQLKTLRDDQTIDIVLRLILVERPD